MTLKFLPMGVGGLVLSALFAAFMSTIDTRLNLGAAYFVNDFYKPFLVKDRDEQHYLLVARFIAPAQLIVAYGLLLLASMSSRYFSFTRRLDRDPD